MGSPLEFQIKFSGFEQYFAAQYDFVLTDATVSKKCLRGWMSNGLAVFYEMLLATIYKHFR